MRNLECFVFHKECLLYLSRTFTLIPVVLTFSCEKLIRKIIICTLKLLHEENTQNNCEPFKNPYKSGNRAVRYLNN